MAISLMYVLIGCTPKVDMEAEQTALRNADTEWAKAAAVKDVDGFTGFVVGSILPPNSPMLTGSEAIRQWVSEMMANPGFAMTWKPTTVEVAAAGDIGWTVGAYELHMQIIGNSMMDRGKYATIWKKQPDGSWKVAVDIFNSDMPLPVETSQQQK